VKTAIFTALFTFLLTPWQIVNNMQKMTSLPDKKPTIKGVIEDGDVKLKFTFDKKSDTLELVRGDESVTLKGDEIPIWQRLFFVKERGKRTDNVIFDLRKAGIDTTKKMMDKTGAQGELVYVIGRDKKEETLPYLAVFKDNHLPWKMEYGKVKVIFSHYHKSSFPLAFPGRIVYQEDGTEEIYNFVQEKFKNEFSD